MDSTQHIFSIPMNDKPTLLTIPRELRDDILERVILSGSMRFLVTKNNAEPRLVSGKTDFRTACKQLHDETKDAETRLVRIVVENGITRPLPIKTEPGQGVWEHMCKITMTIRPNEVSHWAVAGESLVVRTVMAPSLANNNRGRQHRLATALKAALVYLDTPFGRIYPCHDLIWPGQCAVAGLYWHLNGESPQVQVCLGVIKRIRARTLPKFLSASAVGARAT